LSENAFLACKLCQVENERFGRNSLSKSATVSNRTDLKTNLKKSFKQLGSFNPKKSIKLPEPKSLQTGQNRKLLKPPNSQIESFPKNRLRFKWRNNMAYNVGSYTQGRIAGDFLSSRKAAQAERCTPKTTAAALDG
jgi:hypothetical protein